MLPIIVATILINLFLPFTSSYDVPCEVQNSEAFQWGTNTALLTASLLVDTIPPVATGTAGGQLIASVSNGILRFFWPLIVGYNKNCVAEALNQSFSRTQLILGVKLTSHVLEHERSSIQGLTETARKVYRWLPIVNDKGLEECSRKKAFEEYFDELELLYWRSNEERLRLLDATIESTNQEQSIAAFSYIRELAFLQMGVAMEMLANPYRTRQVRLKLADSLKSDAEFYWRNSHILVEKMVKCLPNDRIGSTRLSLLKHLSPMLDMAVKIFKPTLQSTSAVQLAYDPVGNQDIVGFRSNEGEMLRFGFVYRTGQTNVDLCPKCGWDLFPDPMAVSLKCSDRLFVITNHFENRTNFRTCETLSLSHSNNNQHNRNRFIFI